MNFFFTWVEGVFRICIAVVTLSMMHKFGDMSNQILSFVVVIMAFIWIINPLFLNWEEEKKKRDMK